jgi:ABC-2 type transport system ATP-binding protein
MSNILEIKNIAKRYANHTALDGISMDIPEGSIFGLLGPNGAGKTSLIRIINQITGPDEGEVIFKGERLQPKHVEVIGYLPEERGLYKKMKVGEQLMYLAQLKGMKYWFIKFGIQAWWDKNVEDLSKGMQQKTQFVATIVHNPDLIILDEPFSGFDPINVNLLKDEILELKAQGKTIIFSTHRMESVEELCDNIALINKSKVVLAGEKKAIKQQFKDNAYTIEYTGNVPTLGAEYQVIDLQNIAENHYKARVKIGEGGSVNQLIGSLISQTELKYFSENIPSFNEIFIKMVGETANELL